MKEERDAIERAELKKAEKLERERLEKEKKERIEIAKQRSYDTVFATATNKVCNKDSTAEDLEEDFM